MVNCYSIISIYCLIEVPMVDVIQLENDCLNNINKYSSDTEIFPFVLTCDNLSWMSTDLWSNKTLCKNYGKFMVDANLEENKEPVKIQLDDYIQQYLPEAHLSKKMIYIVDSDFAQQVLLEDPSIKYKVITNS